MSTIRERQADQSHMLLGRTRAERLLDGIYQRQKRYLLQRRRRAAAEATRRIVLPEEKRRRLLDVLPEPAVTGTDAAVTAAAVEQRQKAKQQARGAPVGAAAKEKNVEDAVEALQRHLWRRAKFDKAVQLLQQLWQSHFVPETKRCLLAGLLTAASTDNCVSSPSGRSEVFALFRSVVEPMLQRECERRKQAELKEQQERFERTTLRAIQFNDRLQCVVVNERRAARTFNAVQPPGPSGTVAGGDGAAGGHVLSSGGTDAGTRATMAAVAAAAAAAVDREQQKQLHQRRGLTSRKEREGGTDRADVSPRSTDSSGFAAAESKAFGGSPRTTTTDSAGPQENPLRPQTGAFTARSEWKPEEVELDDAEKELLEVLQLRCKTHLLLFTDDAFQFNQQVAELRRVFDTMLQDIEEEEEEGFSDEEACEGGWPRKATPGRHDGTYDFREAEDQKEELRKESLSSTASAEGTTGSPPTAGVNVDSLSAADSAQQQKLEDDEVSETEPRDPRSSGFSKMKDRGRREGKKQTQMASEARDEPTGASGETLSAATHALPSTSVRRAVPGAEKRGRLTTHEEEAGAGEVVGGEAEKSASTIPTCRVEVENQNGVQGTAAAALSPEEAGSSTGHAAGDAEEDEEMPTPEERWPLPLKKGELRNLLRCFFMDCLASLFSYRNMTWARAAVEQLFQHVYLNRFVFNESDSGQIGLWQAQLKSPAKISANVSALRIGEAPVPVQDGRDERITTVHGSMVWSAKQMGS